MTLQIDMDNSNGLLASCKSTLSAPATSTSYGWVTFE